MIKAKTNGFLRKSFSLTLCSVFWFISCVKNKDIYAQKNCAKTNVSYKQDIIPILTTYCLSCHSNNMHSGGIVLENYDDVALEVTSGELYDSIISRNGAPPQMPKGTEPLSTCNVGLIKTWISEGSLNN